MTLASPFDGLLNRSPAWLHRQLLRSQKTAGVEPTIAYRRGAESWVLSAIHGTQTMERTEASGAVITFQSEDFIVSLAAFEAAGAGVPLAGDRITYDGAVFQVSSPGGSPCWEQSGNDHIRVHTKRVQKPAGV